ncbi:uncharacterized protein BROUX77_007659 [Berkeleyomyces rouxiae]|uniref:uncharacterized protein n=1 Tax=Berkeleyomyces rouxiae TaxID=2035830 RepID=UPI003B78E611
MEPVEKPEGIPTVPNIKNIAIIGAGAGGASTAYHLEKFADEAGIAINITIFEREDRVGGRSKTVNAWDDSSLPFEVGSTMFIPENTILVDAVAQAKLRLKTPEMGETQGEFGVWNGEKFVYQHRLEPTDESLWEKLGRFWQYGFDSRKAQTLVEKKIKLFMKLYSKPYFPFRSLEKVVEGVGLKDVTKMTGPELLSKENIGGNYVPEIIQPSTRVNYASNLDETTGMQLLMSTVPDRAYQVRGGNWQIFDYMVSNSKATINYQTAVAEINYDPDSKQDARKDNGMLIYKLKVRKTDADKSEALPYDVTFDDVVIAAPLQYTDMVLHSSMIPSDVRRIKYRKLHVTLFATSNALSPSFFNLENPEDVPDMILTTLPDAESPENDFGKTGRGPSGFYSMTRLRQAMNPKTGYYEYIWKIFSASEPSAEFMSKLLGEHVPDSRAATNEERSPISWYHSESFFAYPTGNPQGAIQPHIFKKGLWCTSTMETFTSSMESSALMGKNVAKLITMSYEEVPVIEA